MRSPEDALLLAIWQGRMVWAGTSVDARELASYLEEMDVDAAPRTPAEVQRTLLDLQDAGLVEQRIRPLSPARGTAIYYTYVLTEEGLARAHELEAQDEHFPPYGDEI
jgi:hypothetical protein